MLNTGYIDKVTICDVGISCSNPERVSHDVGSPGNRGVAQISSIDVDAVIPCPAQDGVKSSGRHNGVTPSIAKQRVMSSTPDDGVITTTGNQVVIARCAAHDGKTVVGGACVNRVVHSASGDNRVDSRSSSNGTILDVAAACIG